jgi:hypothetical protein
MSEKMKIPPIVQIGAWLLSLIVFAVGFWHTHLGLQQMKPFNSEYGSIAIAAIVLILLLITYWFAVNGKTMALIFYIVCGFFFFIFNLNYFYPSYVARVLVQNEAKALNDTLQKYTNGSSVLSLAKNSPAVSDYLSLTTLKSDVTTEITNNGFGPESQKKTNEFNAILSKYNIPLISFSASTASTTNDKVKQDKMKKDVIDAFDKRIQEFMEKGVIKIGNPILFNEGLTELKQLNQKYTKKLEKISADNKAEYPLETIRFNKNVQTIVSFVQELNTIVDKVNNGFEKDKPILKRLDEEVHPRADKLGTIKHTITSIFERIKEIDTWSIILVCLFIDLLVPLAIYLLLRKSESDSDTPDQTFNRPSNFNRTY